MSWKVRLDGTDEGLRLLEERFTKEPEVVAADGEYYLRSERFERVDGTDKIRSEANRIVKSMRVFGTLRSLPVTDLDTSVLVEEDGDGNDHIYVQAEGVGIGLGSANPTIQRGGEEIEPSLPADRTEKLTRLALKDWKVTELANLVDNGDEWVNLYRIFEFIEDNIKDDENILDKGWWSRSEKNRFKRTANSRDALGDSARHGRNKSRPPTNTMSHSEAQSQIQYLIEQWLDHRAEILSEND